MDEYIEREELLKKAIKERRFVFQMEDLLNNEVIFKTVYKDLAEFINSIPAADVTPVRHGRWDKTKEWATKAKYRCSVCGREIMSAVKVNIEKYPYCHCGAKMDGTERS